MYIGAVNDFRVKHKEKRTQAGSDVGRTTLHGRSLYKPGMFRTRFNVWKITCKCAAQTDLCPLRVSICDQWLTRNPLPKWFDNRETY